MSRVCTICTSPDRAEIDKALALGVAAKRQIAARYGLATSSLQRHEANHLAADLIEAAQAKVSDNGTDLSLVGRVTRMVDRLERLAESCTEYGAGKDLLAAARELRPYHELFGRANGQLASDRITALFVGWGVNPQSGEVEIKQALDFRRSLGEASDREAILDALEVLKISLPKVPELLHDARVMIDSLSFAEEVPSKNGHGG